TRREFNALKHAVEGQKQTIEAQSEGLNALTGLLKTMEAVLKSTDETTMLARLQAYKKFVDEEKGALAARYEAQSRVIGTTLAELISLHSKFMPFVPKAIRSEMIEALQLKADGDLKKALHEIAQ